MEKKLLGRRPVKPTTWMDAREDWARGDSPAVIASRYGLSERTVRRHATSWARGDEAVQATVPLVVEEFRATVGPAVGARLGMSATAFMDALMTSGGAVGGAARSVIEALLVAQGEAPRAARLRAKRYVQAVMDLKDADDFRRMHSAGG